MRALLDDLRFSIRSLARRPGHALVTIGALSLAIAANAAVFGVLNALLLKPLPYPDGERLVMVSTSYPKIGVADSGSSIPDYLDRREQAPSLEDLAILTPAPRALTGDGPAEQLSVVRASPSLFTVLGVAPALGRAFTEDEATLGNEQVVVLSETLFRTRFGAEPEIIGRDIELDGLPHRVVGVMPRGFGFPDRSVDAWIPFAFTLEQTSDQARGNDFSITVGRLHDGATIEGLNAELDAITRRVAELGPRFASIIEETGFTARATSLRETIVGDLDRTLLLLQGMVLAVLLIACANVASLQLARMIARRKELAVRAALGAGRARLARLVLAESVGLVVLGAAAGFVLARAGLELVTALGLDKSSEGLDLVLDARVALFTAGTALLGTLVAVFVPLASVLRDDPARAVNEAGRLEGAERGASRFRSGLVVAQVAASFALLVAAGLLTKSFYQLQINGPGFHAEGVLTARFTLPRDGRYVEPEPRRQFYAAVLEALRALPGVTAVGLTSALPFSSENPGAMVSLDGYEPPPGGPPPIAWLRTINEGYFRTLDIPVVAGRNFLATETERVAIVDEDFEAAYWPDGSALGQRMRNAVGPAGEWYTIVGVVPPVKHESLVETRTAGTVYFHYSQLPGVGGFVTLRTSLPPAELSQAAARAIASIDPNVPLYDVMAMDARIAESLSSQRAPMILTLVFAGLAFTLAIVGLYGVLTWAVTRRVGEIGVRMALGARAGDVMRMVLRDGGRLVLVGLAAGLAGALGVGRLLASQLHDVSTADPVIFLIAFIGLAGAAFVACWPPAWRASRVDPMTVLREA